MMANYGPRASYPPWSDAEIERLTELYRRAPWPELLAALPGRTRMSVRQMGHKVLRLERDVNRRPKWTADEIIILRRLYPASSDAELKSALPQHSFIAIQRMACALRILRPRHEARGHGRFVHPIIARLYDERRTQHLKRVSLAPILSYAHGQILNWELGKTRPEFAIVCDWAEALGLEIVLRKKPAKAMRASGHTCTAVDIALGRYVGATAQKLVSLKRAEREGGTTHNVGGLRVPAAVLAERDARIAALEHRSQTQEFCGDPPPGYSALDRRRR